MKVWVVAPSYPPAPGGQEIHLQELSESLMAAGVDVQVLTAAMEPPGADFIDTVPVIRLATFGPIQGGGWRSVPVVALLLVRMFCRLVLSARRYDVVLVSGFNITPLAAVFAKLLTGKPCIVRPESPSELKNVVGAASLTRMRSPGTGMLMKVLAAARGWTAARVDRYIAISSEIREQLIADGIDSHRIVQIANGINMDKFTPVDAAARGGLRVRLGLPHDALLMIYTGRLAVSKGVMVLLRSWAELSALHPDAHLVLIGQGAGSTDDCEAEVRNFIAVHGLQERVTAPGAVTNVSDYLQAADMFVFPSFFEGFGLSIVEAMAVGLPMVCTRVGVARELAGELDGLLVPPEDQVAFTQALARLLADPQLRAVTGRRMRSLVESVFSMQSVARDHAAVFTELAYTRA